MKGEQVLLIIENSCTLRLLSDLFAAAGARVYGTASGEWGLRQSWLCHPDLVVIDLELAGRHSRPGGIRCAFPPGTAVVFLSTLSEEYRQDCGLDFEGADYFVKPFRADALLTRAEQILAQKLPGAGRKPSPRSMNQEPANVGWTPPLSSCPSRPAKVAELAEHPPWNSRNSMERSGVKDPGEIEAGLFASLRMIGQSTFLC